MIGDVIEALLKKEMGDIGEFILKKQCSNIRVDYQHIEMRHVDFLLTCIRDTISPLTGPKKAKEIMDNIQDIYETMEWIETKEGHVASNEILHKMPQILNVLDSIIMVAKWDYALNICEKTMKHVKTLPANKEREYTAIISRYEGFIYLQKWKPKLALESFQRTLNLAIDLNMAFESTMARVGLAHIHRRQGKFKECHNILNVAEDNLNKVKEKEEKIRAFIALYKEYGNMHLDMGKDEKAYEYFQKARNHLEEKNDVEGLGDILLIIGMEEMNSGKLNSANKNLKEALGLFNRSGSLYMQGRCNTELACLYFTMYHESKDNSNLKEAARYLRSADRILKNYDNDFARGRCEQMTAMLAMCNRDWEMAEMSFKEARDYLERAGVSKYVGLLYIDIAKMYKARFNRVSFIEYLEMAENEFSNWPLGLEMIRKIK